MIRKTLLFNALKGSRHLCDVSQVLKGKLFKFLQIQTETTYTQEDKENPGNYRDKVCCCVRIHINMLPLSHNKD